MGNPRHQRLFGRRAAISYRGAPSLAAEVSYAGAQSINADGFTFQDNDATVVGWGTDMNLAGSVPQNNYDAVGDPKVIYVEADGFSSGGSAVKVRDAHTALSRFRQAHPNTSLWAAPSGGEALSTLDQMVFAGDQIVDASGVVGGVTNSSTRAYPKPACLWRHEDLRISSDGAIDAGVYVSHKFARSGRPVACVKFIFSDGTNTVEQLVSSLTDVTHASGLHAPWFLATGVDISGLDEGVCTIDVEVMPWRGPKYTASVDGAGDRNIAFGRQTFVNDKGGFGRAHCVVKSTGTATGTTGVYATEAAMDTAHGGGGNTVVDSLAYPTISAARVAAQSYISANYGTARTGLGLTADCPDGAVVHLTEQTEIIDNWGGANGEFPYTVKARAGTTKANVVLQTPSSNKLSASKKIRIEGLTLEMDGGASIAFGSNSTAANIAEDHFIALVDVTKVLTSGTPNGNIFYRYHRGYLIDCDGPSLLLTRLSGSRADAYVAVGSANEAGGRVHSSVAAKHVQASGFALVGWNNVALSTFPIGPQLHGHGFFGRADDGNVVFVNYANAEGFHFVHSVVERQTLGSTAAVLISGDGDANSVQNVVLHGATVAGQRMNFLYNDSGVSPILKLGELRFCVIDSSYNCKSDTDPGNENGGRWSVDGNTSVEYHVGFRSNAILRSAYSAFGVGAIWAGEIGALGDVLGASLAANWVDDASANGDGTGDGDYTPSGVHDLPAIPAGLAKTSIDFMGRAVANDGTAVAGALQTGG